MGEIFLIILAVILWRRHKRKKERQENPYHIKTKADLKDEAREFKKELAKAREMVGPLAVVAMEKVADAYAAGNGVEQDLKKAVIWKRRELEEKIYLKADYSSMTGVRGYDPEDIVDFFINGKTYPRDAALAKEFALRLLEVEERTCVLILDKIDALRKMGFFEVSNDRNETRAFLQEKSDAGDGWATYTLARYGRKDADENGYRYRELLTLARAQGNLAALCRKEPAYDKSDYDATWKDALDEMDKKYEKLRLDYLLDLVITLKRHELHQKEWQAEAEKAGVVGNLRRTIEWVMEKTGRPAPNGYTFPITKGAFEENKEAREAAFRNYEKACEKQLTGQGLSILVDTYAMASGYGLTDAQYRCALIQLHVLSVCEEDHAYVCGMEDMNAAADKGHIFAQQELGREVDMASMAALAADGNCEAIMRLGMLFDKSGTDMDQQAAQFLYLLCWNTLGDNVSALTTEDIMLKYRLLKCRRYPVEVFTENYLFWLAKAQGRNYPPADYLLLFHYDFGRRFGHGNQRKLAEKAFDVENGFLKAKKVLSYLDLQDKWIGDFASNAAYNHETYKIENENYIYPRMLAAKGLPNRETVTRYSDTPCFTMEDAVKTAEAASGKAASGEQSVRDMPYYIRDDFFRLWQLVSVSKAFFGDGDVALYRLDPTSYEGTFQDVFGTEVYIRDSDLQGNTAVTSRYTFSW